LAKIILGDDSHSGSKFCGERLWTSAMLLTVWWGVAPLRAVFSVESKQAGLDGFHDAFALHLDLNHVFALCCVS